MVLLSEAQPASTFQLCFLDDVYGRRVYETGCFHDGLAASLGLDTSLLMSSA